MGLTKFTRFETMTSRAQGALRARVLNHYKALFIARCGQQVSMAQRLRTVACSARVQRFDTHNVLFFSCFFFITKLNFCSYL